MEKTFSIGIFSQMGCSVLVVSIGVLKAVVVSNHAAIRGVSEIIKIFEFQMPIKSMEFLIMAAYCLSMICEIALYCWYGQKVLDAVSYSLILI